MGLLSKACFGYLCQACKNQEVYHTVLLLCLHVVLPFLCLHTIARYQWLFHWIAEFWCESAGHRPISQYDVHCTGENIAVQALVWPGTIPDIIVCPIDYSSLLETHVFLSREFTCNPGRKSSLFSSGVVLMEWQCTATVSQLCVPSQTFYLERYANRVEYWL